MAVARTQRHEVLRGGESNASCGFHTVVVGGRVGKQVVLASKINFKATTMTDLNEPMKALEFYDIGDPSTVPDPVESSLSTNKLR
jgi:hypothetical protein